MAAKVKRIEGRVRSNLHLDLMPRSWRGVYEMLEKERNDCRFENLCFDLLQPGV